MRGIMGVLVLSLARNALTLTGKGLLALPGGNTVVRKHFLGVGSHLGTDPRADVLRDFLPVFVVEAQSYSKGVRDACC